MGFSHSGAFWYSDVMKIVVLSDTHLNRVTDEFRRICDLYCDKADLVIHLGDWTSGSVLNYMEQYPLEAVAGNMDDYDILDRLPQKKVVSVGDYRLGIIHGWGSARDMRSRISKEFSGVDAVLFGHTHQPFQCEENGIFWFNPGSVFMGRGNYSRSLGILHIEDALRGEIILI